MSTCSIIITTQVVLGEGIKEGVVVGRRKGSWCWLLWSCYRDSTKRERERDSAFHTCFRF